MTLSSRLSVFAAATVLCASYAQAQQAAGTATAAAKKPATTASSSRLKAAPKAPFEAIEARGSNPTGPFARLTESQRDTIVSNTRAMLGIKYKWAGATPEKGVDCSGLVQYVFAKLGIDLPHHAADLAKLGAPVAKDTSEMKPGDLLVFSTPKSKRITHVGIYVGDGMMVHASVDNKQVAETPIVEYHAALLRGVRRVFSVDTAATATATNQTPQP
jgi:cell wall-associated NlpC family hydrolase